MDTLSRKLMLCVIALATTYLVGCAGLHSYPQTAREGDTITLAVGSPKGMNRANTTVTYVPDLGAPVILHNTAGGVTGNLRGIFNLLPDKSSYTWMSDGSMQFLASGGLHTPRITIIALNLAGVPVGTGHIEITSDATYPDYLGLPHINDVDMALEIITGSGAPAPLLFSGLFSNWIADLADLEPLDQLEVAPPKITSTDGAGELLEPSFSAAEIHLTIPNLEIWDKAYLDSALEIFVSEMPQNIDSHLQTMWTTEGNDIVVMFVSPNSSFKYFEIAFSVVGIPALLDTTLASISAATFYNGNGVEVAAPNPLSTLSQWNITEYSVNGP